MKKYYGIVAILLVALFTLYGCAPAAAVPAATEVPAATGSAHTCPNRSQRFA